MIKVVIATAIIFCHLTSASQEGSSKPKVKIEMERFEPPPIEQLDLSIVNIFILNDKNLFYYYDSAFSANGTFDHENIKKLKLPCLHKITEKHLDSFLRDYLKEKDPSEEEIIIASEINDDYLKNEIKQKVKILKIGTIKTGIISKELLTILKNQVPG